MDPPNYRLMYSYDFTKSPIIRNFISKANMV